MCSVLYGSPTKAQTNGATFTSRKQADQALTSFKDPNNLHSLKFFWTPQLMFTHNIWLQVALKTYFWTTGLKLTISTKIKLKTTCLILLLIKD